MSRSLANTYYKFIKYAIGETAVNVYYTNTVGQDRLPVCTDDQMVTVSTSVKSVLPGGGTSARNLANSAKYINL